MKRRHALDALPLWAGNDLPPARRAQVDAHLEACPSCRAEAQALLEALAWLRKDAESPFTPEEGSTLRREVMARVRRSAPPRARRSRAWILLPAAALLLAAAGLALRHSRNQHLPARVSPPSTQALLQPIEAPQAPLHTVCAPRHRSVPPGPRADPQPGSTPPAFTRLEFSTGDPAIRIIWLAQAEPAALSSPSPECP